MASDDKMPSVSKSSSSRFSTKSQVIIDAQDKEIARLKKLLAQAGIDPDQVYVSASRAASRAVQAQVIVAQVQVHYVRLEKTVTKRATGYLRTMKSCHICINQKNAINTTHKEGTKCYLF